MNIFPKYQVSSIHEDAMQRFIADQIREVEFKIIKDGMWMFPEYILPKVYREVGIPKINRISDIIVKVTPRKIFNIECKLNDVGGVLEQAVDHLQWADYSYICLSARTYIPNSDIYIMMKKGIGLMLYDDKTNSLVDLIGAAKNKSINKGIRTTVLKKLIKLDSEKTAESHEQLNIAIKVE